MFVGLLLFTMSMVSSKRPQACKETTSFLRILRSLETIVSAKLRTNGKIANVSDASDLNFSLEAFSLDLEKQDQSFCVTVIRQMPIGQAMALELCIVDAAHAPAPLYET